MYEVSLECMTFSSENDEMHENDRSPGVTSLEFQPMGEVLLSVAEIFNILNNWGVAACCRGCSGFAE